MNATALSEHHDSTEHRRIAVFCGASDGNTPLFAETTLGFAHALVARHHGLVYGGGALGLMGTLANAVLAHHGEVIGVIPKHLVDKEHAHNGLSKLHVVESMHERKALMMALSNGFAILPGGAGTLDEFFEVWTWSQLGLHQKPIGVLNANGYFDKLFAFIEHAITSGFIRAQAYERLIVETDAGKLIDKIDAAATRFENQLPSKRLIEIRILKWVSDITGAISGAWKG